MNPELGERNRLRVRAIVLVSFLLFDFLEYTVRSRSEEGVGRRYVLLLILFLG